MSIEIEIIGEDGSLKIPLSLLYALLRRNLIELRDRKALISREAMNMELSLSDIVPEVGFCPSGEPEPIEVEDEILSSICTELYKYFEDRCAACAIKVFSTLGNQWLVDPETIITILDIAKEYHLPVEWSRGNIVLTTCPEDYDKAYKTLKPGAYIDGLKRLREAVMKLSKILKLV